MVFEHVLDLTFLQITSPTPNNSATHFQLILKEHPPQTSSRASLSNWSCGIHNIVNARLGKPDFDCSTLADVYKCGCADEPGAEDSTEAEP